MEDRERMAKLKTEEMARTPARSTEELRQNAEQAERMRREDQRFMRPGVGTNPSDTKVPLFPEAELDQLRARWTDIQAEFVDEPRKSVEEADHLVAQTVQRLAETFANARTSLEGQWTRGGDVSTEDLRIALQRYRSFFDRLLTV